jgi:hypothetical protein
MSEAEFRGYKTGVLNMIKDARQSDERAERRRSVQRVQGIHISALLDG